MNQKKDIGQLLGLLKDVSSRAKEQNRNRVTKTPNSNQYSQQDNISSQDQNYGMSTENTFNNEESDVILQNNSGSSSFNNDSRRSTSQNQEIKNTRSYDRYSFLNNDYKTKKTDSPSLNNQPNNIENKTLVNQNINLGRYSSYERKSSLPNISPTNNLVRNSSYSNHDILKTNTTNKSYEDHSSFPSIFASSDNINNNNNRMKTNTPYHQTEEEETSEVNQNNEQDDWKPIYKMALARYDYNGNKEENELSFKKGAKILLEKESTSIFWFQGKIIPTGETGYIPGNYMVVIDEMTALTRLARAEQSATVLKEEKGKLVEKLNLVQQKSVDRIAELKNSLIKTREQIGSKLLELHQQNKKLTQENLSQYNTIQTLQNQINKLKEKMVTMSNEMKPTNSPNDRLKNHVRASSIDYGTSTIPDNSQELEQKEKENKSSFDDTMRLLEILSEVVEEEETPNPENPFYVSTEHIETNTDSLNNSSSNNNNSVEKTNTIIPSNEKSVEPPKVENSPKGNSLEDIFKMRKSSVSPDFCPTCGSKMDSIKKIKAMTNKQLMGETNSTKESGTVVFGSDLEDILEKEGTEIPTIVTTICEHLITTENIKIEGVFRVPALKTSLQKLKGLYNKGVKVNLEGENPYLVADLLKEFFRDLSEPLLTFESYQKWMLVGNIEEELKQAYIRALLASLPTPNLFLVEYIINFLMIVNSFSDTNQLTVETITTLFGPLFLTDSKLDIPKDQGKKSTKKERKGGVDSTVENLKTINSILKFLLVNHHNIFQNLNRSGFFFVKAKASNSKNSNNELKFKKGDIIAVFQQKREDVWFGECRLNIGSFDPQLVTKIESTF